MRIHQSGGRKRPNHKKRTIRECPLHVVRRPLPKKVAHLRVQEKRRDVFEDRNVFGYGKLRPMRSFSHDAGREFPSVVLLVSYSGNLLETK